MPFNIGPGELILILVIALVVLGPGKLPDVASSLGKSVREFRKAATDVTEAGRLDATTPTTSAVTPASPVESPAPAAEVADETPATVGTAAAPARDSDAS
jgi:TatA/E family protein of Tat protein translocase